MTPRSLFETAADADFLTREAAKSLADRVLSFAQAKALADRVL